MEKIKVEKYQKGQETEIYQLIKRVYDEFVSVDYSVEGNIFFYDWIQPEKIAERQKNQINLWVVFSNSRIIGMIEIRENKYISLLFVDKEFHGCGIAKRLFHESLKTGLQRDPSLTKFFVHASPFSIPVYSKLGFIATDKMQEENGIKYLPMEMKIGK
jgi:predicted GNAT family N-acyltransferase